MTPSTLPAEVDDLWARRTDLTPADAAARDTVVAAVDMLDRGEARVAVVDPETDRVLVDERAKRAILLSFRVLGMAEATVGPFRHHDRIPSNASARECGSSPGPSRAGAATTRRA